MDNKQMLWWGLGGAAVLGGAWYLAKGKGATQTPALPPGGTGTMQTMAYKAPAANASAQEKLNVQMSNYQKAQSALNSAMSKYAEAKKLYGQGQELYNKAKEIWGQYQEFKNSSPGAFSMNFSASLDGLFNNILGQVKKDFPGLIG